MSLKDGSIITLILFYLFKGRTILFLRGVGLDKYEKTNSCTNVCRRNKNRAWRYKAKEIVAN